MKKTYLWLALVAIVGILAFSSVALAINQHAQTGLAHKVTAQDISDIQAGKRTAFHQGKLVEARIFFHHKPGHDGGSGGGGGEGAATSTIVINEIQIKNLKYLN